MIYINPNKTYSDATGDMSRILEWYDPIHNISDLRGSEKEIIYFPTSNKHAVYIAVYDLRDIVVLESNLGIATTVIVCIVLGAGALIFSKMTTELVITPIENMIEKINNLTSNPQLAAEKEEELLLLQDIQ